MQTVRMLTGAIALASCLLAGVFDAGRLIVHDSITRTEYDGTNDDLLSAGLNHDGLKSTAAAGFADAVNPTPAELRRRAIYNNYRAISGCSRGRRLRSPLGSEARADVRWNSAGPHPRPRVQGISART